MLWYLQAGGNRMCETSARCNHALVSIRFMSFMRIWRGSNISFDNVPLFLPDVHLETEAVYIRCELLFMICHRVHRRLISTESS